MKRLLFLAALGLSASLQSAIPTYQIIENLNPLTIRTPSLESRQTLKLRLPNGLEVFIVSDPLAVKSAAAISVEAGSWNDPEDYPGMAHFCEHMLFMGSEKYTDENGFFKAVFDNGGTANAYTAPDRTVYMFSSNHTPFESVLDIFAHFFIDPLLKKESVKRELLAVNQEHAKNCENDNWREYQVFKATGNQNHPNAKFSTGTEETLSIIPLETLRNWYRLHYSANKMHMAIYTNQDPNQIAKTITSIFSEIPNGNPPSLKYPAILSDAQKGHYIYVEPIQDRRKLSILWEMPTEVATDLDAKVPDLLAYTLQYKGQNSLFQHLKKEGLAEDLSADVDAFGKDCKLLTLTINLTKKGINQLDTVLERSFGLVNHLKTRGIPPHVFNEYKAMLITDYEWQSRSDEFQFVSQAAHTMVGEKLETYPQKTISISTFKPADVLDTLSHLTPANASIFIVASPSLTKQVSDKREKWLKVRYSVTPVDEGKLDEWATIQTHPLVGTPPPNLYVPTDLSLLTKIPANETFEPKLLASDPKGKCYFMKDEFYLVPEVSIRLGIHMPQINAEPRNIALTDLLVIHLEQQLSPTIDVASRGGLTTQISQENLMLNIQISGYQEKADLLLSNILEQLPQVNVSREEFELYKDDLLSRYNNYEHMIPFYQANQLLSSVLLSDSVTGKELHQVLSKVSYEEFVVYSQELFNRVYLEGMITGNMSEDQAKDIWTTTTEKLGSLPFAPEDHSKRSILQLSSNASPYTIQSKSTMQGNGALLMIQIGQASMDHLATQKILSKVLSEAFFDTLRTKQQTAYIAKSWAKEENDLLMLFFGVHSTTHYPNELLARFELFLEEMNRDLETNVPKERFTSLKESIISSLGKPPRNLHSKTAELNYLAYKKHGDFGRRQKVISALQALSYEHFISNAKIYLSRENTKRLAVLVEGTKYDEKSFAYQSISLDEAKAMTHQSAMN